MDSHVQAFEPRTRVYQGSFAVLSLGYSLFHIGLWQLLMSYLVLSDRGTQLQEGNRWGEQLATVFSVSYLSENFAMIYYKFPKP